MRLRVNRLRRRRVGLRHLDDLRLRQRLRIDRRRRCVSDRAADRRRIVIATGPAHAEAHVMRGDVFHRRGIVEEVGAVEIDGVASHTVAEIEITIAQLDREILIDVVGNARMQRPGEVGLGFVLGPAAAAR